MTIHVKDQELTRSSLNLLYDISRELATAIDLNAVLKRVLSLSMENVGAASGSLIVLDDEGQPIESMLIVGSRIIQHTTQELSATLNYGLAGWAVRNSQAALITDTSRDPRWLIRPDDRAERTGRKSAISVPLTTHDRVIGVMTLVHPAPGFFSAAHLSLLQSIADQASIALLNARLYHESQRQARVMQAVAESAAVITDVLDLEEVLQRILVQISRALRVEVVSLALIDQKDGGLIFLASTDQSSHRIIGQRLALGEGIAGWVAQEGRGMIVTESSDDPRFLCEFDRQNGLDTQVVACAPISLHGNVIGVIEAINPLEGSFEPDALKVLTGIGSLAGTAIHNAQLFEQLQAAHRRYLELFEDSINAILITDLAGKILEANRQAELLTGAGKDSLRRLAIHQLITEQDEGAEPQTDPHTYGDTRTYESFLRPDNGRLIPIQIYIRIVKIEDDDCLQWIIQDISERKDLDRLREDLISMVYHDLRSPLANIVSSLDVVAALLPPQVDPAVRSLLNIAMRSTERIQRLTNSLLDIKRLESNQPVGNLSTVSLSQLGKETIEAVQPLADGKGQTLHLNIPADLPQIRIEADMIRRVLINLAENAVKYSPPGGQIYLGAQLGEDWITIWVQDTGPGIPPVEKDRIFDKYTRLNTMDGPKGIGLGLNYCRLAVEGHGGRIWVESQPDEGSRFCFTLPIGNR
ncbi:MAG TPA: GAF domain-containing protein [Anaerolineales bacterium]|nr:GAF domain-containing protein [Anaerolineales bacterium]